MPIVMVYIPKSFFDEGLTPLKLSSAIKNWVEYIEQLELTGEEVSVIFPECSMSNNEVIVFVKGIYEKPERTLPVFRKLARTIRNHLVKIFPEAKRVECFIFPFDPIAKVCSSSTETSRCVDCDGEINTKNSVLVQAGCACSGIFKDAVPCKKCGLLHWKDGLYPIEGTHLESGKVIYKK